MTAVETKHPILDLERSALERWCRGDPDGFLEISAPEITYFDPFRESRVDGLAALSRIYDELRGTVSVPYFEILNPVVQELGDGAVLSYNLVCHLDREGERRVRWHSTEVYRRDAEGGWRLVQSHWSYAWPPPTQRIG